MARALWSLVVLLIAAGCARAAETLQPQDSRRSDDNPKWYTFRDRFIHEARPDFLRLEYERLFGEPWHDEGWHPLDRFRPFEDNQQLDNAMDRYYFNNVQAAVQPAGERVALVVRMPDTADDGMKVWINQNRVLLSAQPDESTRSAWHFRQPKEQSLPVPDGADYKTAQITREGDVVTISFARKP